MGDTVGPWKCFYCGEVFTNEKSARDHFGLNDGDAWEAGCVDPLTLDQKANRAAYICLFQELDAERDENHRLNNTVTAALEALEAMLEFHHGPRGQRSYGYNAALLAEAAIAGAP